MKLELKNIGMIKEANIDISGITVVAGENNTGKTTIGKALFVIFNAFSKSKNKINEERVKAIFYILDNIIKTRNIVGDKNPLNKINSVKMLPESMLQFFHENMENDGFNFLLQDERMRINIFLNSNDDDLFKLILQSYLTANFKDQITSLSERETTIALKLKEDVNIIKIQDKKLSFENNRQLTNKAILIDSPIILDEVKHFNNVYIQDSIERSYKTAISLLLTQNNEQPLLIQEQTKKKLENVLKIFNEIGIGELKENNQEFIYQENNQNFDLINVATGIKTFVIIKTLLLNGALQENGVLILDEPEVHLHPNYQIKLAEILVLLRKEFNLHILINSHSPYFINAIETYSLKYEIDDTHLYLSQKQDGFVKFKDLSENTDEIYDLLSVAFDDLRKTRNDL